MTLINALALLYNIAPQAVETFLTMYTIIFFMLIVDTLLRLFALTFSKKPLWHYRTIIDVFWGGWGQQKSSRVFYRGFLFKLFEYSVLSIFAFLLDAIVIPSSIHMLYFQDIFDVIAWICYGYIVLTELFSFKENMKLIRYNNEIINSLPKDVIDRITDVDLNVVKFKLKEKKVRKKMSKIFKMMLFENEELSYTRMISFTLLLLLVGVTLYLVITGHNWQHYDTLANLTGGGSAATQIANKFINSKYNSEAGTYKEKNDAE